MKASINAHSNPFFQVNLILMFALYLLFTPKAHAQAFQKIFGTNLDNSFSKVIQDGSEYYVLGQDQPFTGAVSRATVSRLASDGSLLWTKSLDIASQWNDAIRVNNGDLILVGNSLPGDASSKSIMGRITNTGSFAWTKSYDEPGGRDFFLHIIENPAPQNPNFPFYVLGGQRETSGPSSTWDDVVILNINGSGNFNWKKIYVSNSDDEFFRDFLAFPNGEMLISGSRLNPQNDHSGIFYITSNDGTLLSGKIANWMNYPDITAIQNGGGFYMASNSEVGQSPFISKFDQNYNQLWQVQIPKLSSISQIWESTTGDIYATGIGLFGSLRTVLLKLKDNSPNIPTLVWAKYINIGNNFIGGSSWLMPTNDLIFTDGRNAPSGFGGRCAFISKSDLDLNTCNVSNETIVFTPTNLAPINQVLFPIKNIDTIAGSNISNNYLVWREGNECKSCCADTTTFANLINQGFNIVINDCKATVTAPQFDSCYFFSTPPVFDGANVPQVITNPNGMWMYNVTQNGSHQVCVNIFDECNSQKMCTSFNITACDTCVCGGFEIKYAIDRNIPELKKCGDTLNVPSSMSILPIRFLTSFTCLGTNCPQAVVQWQLQGPVGFNALSGSVVANPGFTIPINNSSFSIAGLYTLTMIGNCGTNKCQCVIYFNAQGYECCGNPFDFDLAIQNAISLQIDSANCKATLNIGNFPLCDNVSLIQWGDNSQSSGPFSAGSMPMHTYNSSGTFIISWTASEYNHSITPPQLCNRTIIKDTVVISCGIDSCIYVPCANSAWMNISNIPFIEDMIVYQGKLIVAGSFTNLNGANFIAAWNGTSWSALGNGGPNGQLNDLEVHNGLLYAGGSFSSPGSNIAVWNGLAWNALGVGTNGPVNALFSLNSTNLFLGGHFSSAGGIAANNVVYTNNNTWFTLPDFTGSNGTNGEVNVINNYLGSIVVGGKFNLAGASTNVSNIALWNGSNNWAGIGINGINLIPNNNGQGVAALQVINNDLIAGGRFLDADGVAGTAHIAKWDGFNWNSLSGGVNTSYEGIYDLELFGGELYAGGLFTNIGGNPISGVALWNGTNWLTTNHPNQLVKALAYYMPMDSTCDLYSGGEVFINHQQCITSLEETLMDDILIYPNPTEGNLIVDLHYFRNSDLSYIIKDIAGKSILEIHKKAGSQIQSVDASALSPGVYFLQVRCKGKLVAIEKWIKQ
ncbi:MAG: T9SS type A sorting domain-containing protein [Saprospiraceae bacterium]|nr:T9SS type A sorting domain-containing protein [Saprospiraceae bacterium]